MLGQLDISVCGVAGLNSWVDPLSLALNNQVRITATLLADVGIRYPGAFAAAVPIT